MKKNGRPTKYQERYDEEAEKLCRLGATDLELSDFFKVDEKTVQNWKHDFPSFFQAIKRGKDDFDTELIEQSLRKRATGYNRVVQRVGKDGELYDTIEELPPDPVSMIFWLKNRKAARWRDKQEHQLSGNINVAPVLNYGVKKD